MPNHGRTRRDAAWIALEDGYVEATLWTNFGGIDVTIAEKGEPEVRLSLTDRQIDAVIAAVSLCRVGEVKP